MQSFTDVWNRSLVLIRPNVSEISFDTWIKLMKPLKLENNVAYFYVRSQFQKGTILNQFQKIIERALSDTMGFPIQIDIITEAEAPPRIIEQGKKNEEQFNAVLDKTEKYYTFPRETLTFENFVVGEENKFAHAAAVAVANNPGQAYNPLLIYGRSGLGKTHLMCAIANEIRKNDPKKNILYVRCEEFGNELIENLQKKTMTLFRNKYRNVDALLIDDIQFLGNKEQMQEEFFHTFEALYEGGKQIIITADRMPKEIIRLSERIVGRLEMGLLADIQPPGFETRCAIIKNKAASLDLNLSNDIVEFVAQKLHTNVRELEGAINKIKAYNMLHNERPTLAVARNAIASVMSENVPVSVSMDLILDTVARYYNISTDDIKSKKRTAFIVNARQVCMYIARQMTQLSLENIGQPFGGKDHSTVLYAAQKIEESVRHDPKLAQDINDLMENIKRSF